MAQKQFTAKEIKERLKFEIGYEKERFKEGNKKLNDFQIEEHYYWEGFIDGLKRSLELTNPKH